MDSVLSYLPSPKDRHHEFVEAYSANNLLCALAFKIQNDSQRGPLTFLRIYSGAIETVHYFIILNLFTLRSQILTLVKKFNRMIPQKNFNFVFDFLKLTSIFTFE